MINTSTATQFEQALPPVSLPAPSGSADLLVHFSARMVHIMDDIAQLKAKVLTNKKIGPPFTKPLC